MSAVCRSLPLASFRFCLVILAVGLGFLITISLARLPLYALQVVGLCIVIIRVVEKLTPDPMSGFALWTQYDVIGKLPFYYIYSLFS